MFRTASGRPLTEGAEEHDDRFLCGGVVSDEADEVLARSEGARRRGRCVVLVVRDESGGDENVCGLAAEGAGDGAAGLDVRVRAPA